MAPTSVIQSVTGPISLLWREEGRSHIKKQETAASPSTASVPAWMLLVGRRATGLKTSKSTLTQRATVNESGFPGKQLEGLYDLFISLQVPAGPEHPWNNLKLLEKKNSPNNKPKRQTQQITFALQWFIGFPRSVWHPAKTKETNKKNIQDINLLEQGSAISQKSCHTIFSKHQSNSSANKRARNCRLFFPVIKFTVVVCIPGRSQQD